MDLKNLNEIQALVEAKYEIRRQAFQTLVVRENGLRTEIQRIDQQAQLANAQDNDSMRAIGADVIWKAWVGKAKSSLNTKLALVLAEKEQHVQQVKQAYGKVVAAEALAKDFISQQSKNSRDTALQKAMESALFSPQHRK